MKQMTLEEIRKCSLAILNYVDVVCEKMGLTYYLCAGTMLGAVRHKGFIPWDDDLDIMMPRRDYEQLAKSFPKDGHYDFLTLYNTSDFPYAFGKIIDTRTIKNEAIRPKYQMIGVDIDVFPIDIYPDSIEESQKLCDEISKVQSKLYNYLADFGRGRNWLTTILRNVRIAFWHCLDNVHIRTVPHYVMEINKKAQSYNQSASDFCGITSIAHYGVKERNKKNIFASTVKVEFEGGFYPAPIGYKEYLTNLYGDYMQLPPLSQRKTHHTFTAYWK